MNPYNYNKFTKSQKPKTFSLGQQFINEAFRPKQSSVLPQFDMVLGAILSGIEAGNALKRERDERAEEDEIYASGDMDRIARINPKYAMYKAHQEANRAAAELKERDRQDRLTLEDRKLAQALEIANQKNAQRASEYQQKLEQKTQEREQKDEAKKAADTEKRINRLGKMITDPVSLGYIRNHPEELDDIENNLETNRNSVARVFDNYSPFKNPPKNNFKIKKSYMNAPKGMKLELSEEDIARMRKAGLNI